MWNTSLDRILGIVACGAVMTGLGGCAATPPRPDVAELTRQVADTERAFAKTMADRNQAAFATFLAPETIFFAGAKALRGKQALIDAWKRFYDGPAAPFSWKAASSLLGSASSAGIRSVKRLSSPGRSRVIT